ncbi:DUF1028 domain-containing protein [Limnohabitans sp.]|jgi:uncharacterized Ntn-hydrolase superfamily protein|uniref:DUF1028 domain-containing protein n=1 Tax=Limnohabitans sp. TaxID=1907725 RepID=UPI0037BE80E3
MTWSILARDEHGHFGVAIASRFFAVGALCVHSRRGVGALSTQALMNPLYGPAGIEALGSGYSAADTLSTLLAADEGRDQRQALMASPNSPTHGHPKFPQAAPSDYDPSAWMAKRAAASLSL